MSPRFLIIEPWTHNLSRRFIDATVVSEHATAAEAFAALDALAERMPRRVSRRTCLNGSSLTRRAVP